MSYTVAEPPPAKSRPGVVSFASILLYLAAALLLIQVAVSFVPNDEVTRIVEEYNRTHPDNAGSGDSVVGYVVLAFEVLVAGAFIALAVLNGKGKQPARIVTWVLAGLAVLCLSCSAVLTSFATSMTSENADLQDAIDLARQIQDATPAWQAILGMVVTIGVPVLLVVVIILLALPASNDFFRKEQEVWVPPTYPGTPQP